MAKINNTDVAALQDFGFAADPLRPEAIYRMYVDMVAQEISIVDEDFDILFTFNAGGGSVGPGTVNRLAKFTPDGTHVGDSQLFDNGASVAIGTAAPNVSALFQLESTTKGFLTPRMTTLQRNAIAAPATGLLIYNTGTNLFNYWDGATWQEIDSNATSEWLLDGNTNGVVKYIGTNDAFDLPIYTNGVERMRVLSTGQVGIGTAVPVDSLQVVGGNILLESGNYYSLSGSINPNFWRLLKFGANVVVQGIGADGGQFRIEDSQTGNSRFNVNLDVDGKIGMGVSAPVAFVDILQTVSTGGSPQAFLLTSAAHLNLAAVEDIGAHFNFSATKQFNAVGGPLIANQREIYFSAPTYSGVGGLITFTNVSTIAISGAPILGANAGFANTPLAVLIETGDVRIRGEQSGGAGTNMLSGCLIFGDESLIPSNNTNNPIAAIRSVDDSCFMSMTNIFAGLDAVAGFTANSDVAEVAIVALSSINNSINPAWAGFGIVAATSSTLVIASTDDVIFAPGITEAARFLAAGNLQFADAKNIVFNTVTGTMIGTAANQKFALWGSAPIVQPTNAIAAAVFAANTSGIADDSATFGGYTLGQIVQALQDIGALA